MQIRLSGGPANSDPALSLGGIMSSVNVSADTLFDPVSQAQAASGSTEYRCVYVTNESSTLAFDVRVWISVQPTVGRLALALDQVGFNVYAPTIANEETSPGGETFVDPTDPVENALLIRDVMSQGQLQAVWVRRTIPANSSAIELASNSAVLRVEYRTKN